MKDWPVIATLVGGLLLCAFASTSAWREHQCEAARVRNKERNHPPEIVALPCVADTEGRNQTAETENTTADRNGFEMKPEWWLVAVGILTTLVIGWQAWETRRAANQTRRSVASSERHFAMLNAQWLDAEDFVCQPMMPLHDKELAVWFITFKIRNNTPLIVTIKSIEYYVDQIVNIMQLQKTVGPHCDAPIEFVSIMSDECALALKTNRQCGVLMLGRINYLNALGEMVSQPFGKGGTVHDQTQTRLTKEIGADLDHIFQKMKADAQAKSQS